jgi:hypothetical protein
MPMIPETQREHGWAFFEFYRGDVAAARRHVDRSGGLAASSAYATLYGAVYRLTGARARGDSLLRQRLAVQRSEHRRVGDVTGNPAGGLAYTFAALGARDSALRYLARWDSLGGLTSLARFDRDPGWTALRGDARARAIVARMDARFAAARARVRGRLTEERFADAAR